MDSDSKKDIFRVWRPFQLGEGKMFHCQLSSLHLWVVRNEGEWRIALDHRDDDCGGIRIIEDAEAPESLDWRRFIVGDDGNALQLQPLMPDRPVIVRPEEPITMVSGRKTTFFVGVPVFIRVFAGKNALCELPSEIMSNSWFGTPIQGELCYSFHTKGRRSAQQLSPQSNRAVCPIEIRNESGQDLNFERICLRAPYLSIYQGIERLWNGMVRVTRHREQRLGDIEYVEGPPSFDGASSRLGTQREAPEKSILFKTFDNFNLNLPRL
ncbi:MAG: hypothetical protein A2X49_07270 [Lentisphaerae bacterium GWF2_52_8]|nr:MAG: hypothetical protein A2X49_07270 [Lentisphaerae bacterium GWF2_52_8]